jgi:hypothetical protein
MKDDRYATKRDAQVHKTQVELRMGPMSQPQG